MHCDNQLTGHTAIADGRDVKALRGLQETQSGCHALAVSHSSVSAANSAH